MARAEITTTKKDTSTDTCHVFSRQARVARHYKPTTHTRYARINTLNQIMPNAGLRHSHTRHIGLKLSTDHRITCALFKAFGRTLTTEEVDETMARIYHTATDLIRTLAYISNSNKPVIGPICFIHKIWSRLLTLDSTKWVRGMTFKIFSHFFMIIRAARLRWLKGHRAPFGQDQVSLLATSIDQFEAAAEGRIQWVGAEMVQWLRHKKQARGGLERQLDVLLEEEEEPSVEMDGVYEDGEKINGGTGEGDDIMKDICKQLGDFCLEVPDSKVLAEALEKLSL